MSVAGGNRRRDRCSVNWFSLAENASFDLFRSLLVVSGDFEWAALYAHLLGALAREVEEFCIKFALDCLLSEEIPLQCIRIDLHQRSLDFSFGFEIIFILCCFVLMKCNVLEDDLGLLVN